MHVKATGSQKAREILEHFSEWLPKFKAVISDEYLAWLSQGYIPGSAINRDGLSSGRYR